MGGWLGMKRRSLLSPGGVLACLLCVPCSLSFTCLPLLGGHHPRLGSCGRVGRAAAGVSICLPRHAIPCLRATGRPLSVSATVSAQSSTLSADEAGVGEGGAGTVRVFDGAVSSLLVPRLIAYVCRVG